MSVRAAITRGLRPLASGYYRLHPGIRILMYHRVRNAPAYDQLSVSTARFEAQMAYLARNCRVLSMNEALDELAGTVTSPGVAVTFDDGYLDNLTEALPILRRYAIPATIFVTAGFSGQTLSHPRYPNADGPSRLHLNWDEVRELSRDPLIQIGSHTLTHPFLSRTAESQAWAEIADSRRQIQAQLGQPVDLFCYPSGDVGSREAQLVRRAGYRAAVTVAPGQNRPGQSAFELKRTEMTDRDSESELADKLAGAYDLPHALLHWRRTRRFRAAARAAHVQPLTESHP